MSLPAVILVGGLGTRLRPLTDLTRKDMLPLVDRPQLAYTFEHLRRHGVTRAIVSCGYLPTQIQERFGDRYGDLRLEYRIEEEPLGTGGAIRFAAEGIDEPFFALNGDSLRETDLVELVRFHRERGGRATILLTAHAELEKLVSTIHQNQLKPDLDRRWAYLVYAGLWWEPLRGDLDAYMDRVNEQVTGTISLKLFKGSARVVRRESPNAVYDAALAGFGESGGLFSQQASPGFIELWSLQSRMAWRLRAREEES